MGVPEDRGQREYDHKDRANGKDEVGPELEGVFFGGHRCLVCMTEGTILDVASAGSDQEGNGGKHGYTVCDRDCEAAH